FYSTLSASSHQQLQQERKSDEQQAINLEKENKVPRIDQASIAQHQQQQRLTTNHERADSEAEHIPPKVESTRINQGRCVAECKSTLSASSHQQLQQEIKRKSDQQQQAINLEKGHKVIRIDQASIAQDQQQQRLTTNHERADSEAEHIPAKVESTRIN
ncbi:unnamed protein product, partial [Lampetra planeri]